MSAPTPPPNPLIRQSNPAPTGAAAAAPPVSPSPTAQPRRKVTPERRAFSWSRPFRFALQPKILFFGILPAGLALSFFDPLGLYVKVERGLDKRTSRKGTEPSSSRSRQAGSRLIGARPISSAPPSTTTSRSTKQWDDARPSTLYRSFSTLSKPIKVLALESSADDSCAAIVDSERKIWSNVVIKQHETNAKWGGIHPREAQLAHAANLPKAIARALSESGLGIEDIDVVAFTRGPGMPGCLHVCGNAARAIAATNGKPILGIHHMQAHTLTPLLTEDDPPSFPFLTLLVSGGHTQIVLAEAWDKFAILADSLDSRVGNAVDRIARYIQLPAMPDKGQGAMLEHYASLPPLPPYDTKPLEPLPIPMGKGTQTSRSLAFSFSGLTSHAERLVDALASSTGASPPGEEATSARQTIDIPMQISASTSGTAYDAVAEDGFRMRTAKMTLDEPTKREVARVFQDAVMSHIAQKIALCFDLHAEKLRDVSGMVMSGGVASNQYLRTRIQQVLDNLQERDKPVKLYFPPIELCTDNAAMIAWAAIFRLKAGNMGDSYDLLTRPKWSLEELYDGR